FGTFRSGTIVMNVPRAVRAVFDPVPFVDQSGVRNAAGDTPELVVAPGSISAVYGVNLAPYYEAGPASPLAQAIAVVAVRVDNRFLPLVFVSPDQINFQTPTDLDEGAYKLIIRWDGRPEVTTDLRVARNAPGLFARKTGTQSFAIAAHEDGSE